MIRLLLGIVIASAIYGFSIGSVHSIRFGCHNLLKFPLLLLGTSAICAIAYTVFARFVAPTLRFRDVQTMALCIFRDASFLLASLAPACFFLARTLDQPDREGLNEYPLFLGLNVLFIAVCGTVALIRQARLLLLRHRLSWKRSAAVIVLWLGLSLFAGGQCAWYLRPFFGISSIPGEITPFILGTMPDFRGATNFYEAVYDVLTPPPLPDDYWRSPSRTR